MEYRKDIQGLRALAVIFVLVFHINPLWLPGGFIGVDVFFVISGFLVSSIILKKLEAGTFTFTDFYTGRLKRIVPAYYFMLLFTCIAGAMLLIGDNVTTLKRELAHAMLFNSNYVYAQQDSYFGMSVQQDPLLHTWTIAIEMKVYLLLPLLLFWVKRKLLVPVITCVSILLLLYGTYLIEIDNASAQAYYALLVRIPEFCVGVLLALLLKGRGISGRFKTYSGICGLAILFLCAFLFSHETHFPGLAALLPCIGAVLLLLANDGPVHKLLCTKPLEFTGTLSYSLYLWHWPIIAFVRYYYDVNEFPVIQTLLIVVATFAVAWVSYTFVERFFMKKTAAFWYGIIAPGMVLTALYFCMPALNKRILNIPQEYTGPVIGLPSNNSVFVETFGDKSKHPQIFLTGNSHALSMKPYLDYLGRKRHFSFRTLTSYSYPPIEGITRKDALQGGRYVDYIESLPLIPVANKEIENAKIIIIAVNDWDVVPTLCTAIKSTALKLRKDQHLILLTPFPVLDKNPLHVNRSIVKDYDKAQDYKVIYRKPTPWIRQLAATMPNVHLLDLEKNSIFNDAPFYNDTLMYYDKVHLNHYGAEVLAKHTEKQLMDLLDALP
ncbi:hypothetical protein AM493_05100 [Flavobacterium akiainvivens]|uniref:Acyltransferase n=1 Tax=Flavobacterium akiainvivens TaxID=1202724 RepID=A0A0M8MG73_9FLAO|nr:acyltransferase family protein [Flavobacterium akiainvivens]KOS08214.1 hypothetical protein AM493_05100 [Flavobacterium akiainvivens]SFQ32697.1 Peptidoglycan/LPS O-acetylase OafA/YrhL, contains acyltransferase and SGNH-hydrolase domains [Flavobacterium akiainvivens]